jgi:hypothetical protein
MARAPRVTGYAGYSEWGLASNQHRDQGILGYQFMITNTRSGPYSWWESMQAPDPTSAWIGNHPTAGAGAGRPAPARTTRFDLGRSRRLSCLSR